MHWIGGWVGGNFNNIMSLTRFSEPNSRSAGYEIVPILWNLKIYYRVETSLPLEPLLSPAVFNRRAVAPWGAMNDSLGRLGFFRIQR
jgi:hypothetical protein